MNNNIKNQELTTTTKVKGLLSYQSIGTLQQNYPLTELDFELIQNGKSQTNNWAHGISLATVGYSLGLFQNFFDANETISTSEWGALGVGIIFSFLLYIIGYFLPNKRKKVINNIKQHFIDAPKQQILMEQNNDNS